MSTPIPVSISNAAAVSRIWDTKTPGTQISIELAAGGGAITEVVGGVVEVVVTTSEVVELVVVGPPVELEQAVASSARATIRMYCFRVCSQGWRRAARYPEYDRCGSHLLRHDPFACG